MPSSATRPGKSQSCTVDGTSEDCAGTGAGRKSRVSQRYRGFWLRLTISGAMRSKGTPPEGYCVAEIERAVDEIYRAEWGRIFATLIRLVGDFEVAEEAAQGSFAAANRGLGARYSAEPTRLVDPDGAPQSDRGLRRETKLHEKLKKVGGERSESNRELFERNRNDQSALANDRLRLIFTCCHLALAMDAQVALTLRTLCGLTTEEIARAFVVPIHPTKIVTLNRAVAVAMAEGPERAIGIVDAAGGNILEGYHLLHAVRADLLRQLGKLLRPIGAPSAWSATRRSDDFSSSDFERSARKRQLHLHDRSDFN